MPNAGCLTVVVHTGSLTEPAVHDVSRRQRRHSPVKQSRRFHDSGRWSLSSTPVHYVAFMNDPVEFWLTVTTTALITLVGVWLTNKYAGRLARQSGALSKPELSAWLCGLPTRNGGGATPLIYVLPESPERYAQGYLTAIVYNGGGRAAEDVYAHLSSPRVTFGPDEGEQIISRGLTPGRQVAREVVGQIGTTSVYWPHIAPGCSEAFKQHFFLESTSLALDFNDVVTSDGTAVNFSARAEVAWTASLSIGSKEGAWPGASVSIQVKVGQTLKEVGARYLEEVRQLRRTTSGVDEAVGLRRFIRSARLWISGRPLRAPVAFLVVPHLDTVTDEEGGSEFQQEDPTKSQFHAVFQIWRGIAIVPVDNTSKFGTNTRP